MAKKEKEQKRKIEKHTGSQKKFFPKENASKKEIKEFVENLIKRLEGDTCPTCGRPFIFKKVRGTYNKRMAAMFDRREARRKGTGGPSLTEELGRLIVKHDPYATDLSEVG